MKSIIHLVKSIWFIYFIIYLFIYLFIIIKDSWTIITG